MADTPGNCGTGAGGFRSGNKCARKRLGTAISNLSEHEYYRIMVQEHPAGKAGELAERTAAGIAAGEVAQDLDAAPTVDAAHMSLKDVRRAYVVSLAEYPQGPAREGMATLTAKAGAVTGHSAGPDVAIITAKGDAGKVLRGLQAKSFHEAVLARGGGQGTTVLWERHAGPVHESKSGWQYKQVTPGVWLKGREAVMPWLISSEKVPEDVKAMAMGQARAVALSADGPAFIIEADAFPPPKPVPLGLQGRPTFEEVPTDEPTGIDNQGNPVYGRRRVPVEYYRKEIARVGEWTHPTELDERTGEPLRYVFTREYFDRLAENFRGLATDGLSPFVPDYHVTAYNASLNNGEIVDVRRDGDSLYVDMKLVGAGAVEKALKNKVSGYFVQAARNAKGKTYTGGVLHHVALTPRPGQPNLNNYQRIAASAAGEPDISVPVVTLCACTNESDQQRSIDMLPKETIDKLRAKFKLTADAKDADVLVKAADAALADPPPDKSAEVTALSATVKTLEQERDAAKQQVLALSGNAPREPDPMSLALITRAFKTDRERVIESGVISEAGMAELDALLLPGGKPTPAALALSAGSVDPHYSRVCDILRRNPGVKTDNAVARGTPTDPPVRGQLSLSGTGVVDDKGEPVKPERLRELAAMAGVFLPAAKAG